MSDDQETLFESEQELSVAAVARRLHEVAEGLEAGGFQLGDHAVAPTSPVRWEEEYYAEATDEGTTYEIELELKWSSAEADGQAGQPASGSEPGARGKFELFKDAGGKFRFHLKAGNGEIIASSEAYETKAAAQKGIKSVRTNASSARVDDQS